MVLPRCDSGAVFCLAGRVSGAPAWRSWCFGEGGLRNGGAPGETFGVLRGGGQQELVGGAGEPPEPQPFEAEMAFQVGEQHLDLLALAPGRLERLGLGQ